MRLKKKKKKEDLYSQKSIIKRLRKNKSQSIKFHEYFSQVPANLDKKRGIKYVF